MFKYVVCCSLVGPQKYYYEWWVDGGGWVEDYTDDEAILASLAGVGAGAELGKKRRKTSWGCTRSSSAQAEIVLYLN